MQTASGLALARATKTARTGVRNDKNGEHVFAFVIADIARMLWPPPKTAAQVAAAIGCSERAAEFYLSGDREWSGDAIAIIVSEILRRHHMRNVRIINRNDRKANREGFGSNSAGR
jgi:hypothetical protein